MQVQWGSLRAVGRDLERDACWLETLWLDHSAVWQDLSWTKAQARLWLCCLPGIQVDLSDPLNPSYLLAETGRAAEPSLADHLVAILGSSGQPVPIKQLMHKLPPGMIVSEPMLQAAVNADPRLRMTGPLVRLTS